MKINKSDYKWIIIIVIMLVVFFHLYNNVSSSGGISSGSVYCESCGNKVTNIFTKKDNAGVVRKWCSKCWSDYDEIMGN